jgi:hypothetical protein
MERASGENVALDAVLPQPLLPEPEVETGATMAVWLIIDVLEASFLRLCHDQFTRHSSSGSSPSSFQNGSL